MRPSTALAFVLGVLACGSPAAPAAAPEAAAVAREDGGLRFAVRAPRSAPYDPGSLGIGGRFVTLHVRNASDRPVAIAGLEVTFSAKRNGVAFACPPRRPSSLASRLPATLAPGASFDVDRELDCTMPLPGVYHVDVFARTDAAPSPGLAGSFQLELLPGAREPKPLGPPGLYGLMMGGRATPPLTPHAWSEGDYHVVVAVINGGARAVSLGPAKLAFVVYKKGSPFPCTSEAKPLALPDELPPGGVYTAQLPISCAPSEEGQYQVSGRIQLDDRDEVEIGKLGLHVTRDPLLFTPLPLP